MCRTRPQPCTRRPRHDLILDLDLDFDRILVVTWLQDELQAVLKDVDGLYEGWGAEDGGRQRMALEQN